MNRLCATWLPTLLACALVAPLASQDAVLQWNSAALDAIRAGSTAPPPASRMLAILNASIFDAVNGTRPAYSHYLVAPAAADGASEIAAGSSAARDVLAAFYPAQRATFDALHAQILAGVPDGQKKTDGIAWGQKVAAAVMAARVDDGWNKTAPYLGSDKPGLWRPTISFGNVVRPALLPLWGKVTPFALKNGRQFRPPAPPKLQSVQYAVEQWMVQYFGGEKSRLRTKDQTEVARFWSYGPGTATPPGHLNEVALAVAAKRKESLVENARLFALMNIAMADAAIVSWDCKYEFGLWRPITSIPLAGTDGNSLTRPDKDWKPLLETPPFPEYTSGHSTFSGAAAMILALFYGTDQMSFTIGSDDLRGIKRSYQRFSEAAFESGMSRIFGGIHFMSANLYGLGTGVQVAKYAWDNLLRPLR
ncbi:MAG: phosphatase PAP2 family protein [Planctomycetes bacterium]|nr:phosphatase PAP2 family protein [Planctomycetota bacterium]MCB9890500.1 phosphatase PAP2 family protein [Planctomycetota bacterium]MCB9917741.1 phosphatase PAP2 family protein [Planctomycetota bacterium]